MTFALLTLLACFPEIKESEEGRFIENPSNDFDGDDYTEEQGDCDDRNPNVYPNGTEVCDGFDNDCNGVVDDNPSDIVTYYADMDGDGFGIESDTELACPADKPDGYIEEKVRNGQVVFDCDDTPADEESENGRAVNPDEDEICDEIDNDCDGEVDEEDSEQINRWYPDNDGDGFGVYDDETLVVYYCDQPDGHSPNFLDCDDSNPDIFPNADEYCDGVDNNCDSVIDEGTAVDSVLWIEDADTDGYGTNFVTRRSCDQPEGFVSEENGGDCNDADVSINPNAVESCNTADDNCNGLVDEGSGSTAPIGSQTYYADIDGDGYGDINSPLTQCDVVTGYVANSSDCDDNNSDVNPVATESCNGFDDNCDGSIDAEDAIDRTAWYADTDGDGEGDGGSIEFACDQPVGYVANLDDCVDTDASINTSATEICDSVDNNCDGLIDDADANVDLNTATEFFEDADFDGYGDPLQSTFSCLQLPGFVNNSDDCDDGNLLINPIGVEVCNDTDDDCNGVKDDLAIGSIDYFVDVDGDGHGSLVDVGTGYDLNSCPDYDPVFLYPINPTGYAPTNDDCDDGDAAISPSASELCSNGIDENCDGHNTAGATDVSTFLVDADGDTFGSGERDSNDELAYALDLCVQPYGYVPYVVGDSLDCDDGDVDVKPGVVELCNGKRDDCPLDGDNSVPSDEWDDDGDGFIECEIDSSFLYNPDGTVNLWNNNQVVFGGEDCNDDILQLGDEVFPNNLMNTELAFPGGCYLDQDYDGYGDSQASQAPSGLYTPGTDCDDSNADRYPFAEEICNGIFENCNDLNYSEIVGPSLEDDGDGDGYVECEGFDPNIWLGGPNVIGGEDCNDGSVITFPGGAPLTDATACLTDADGDGYSDRLWSLCPAEQTLSEARVQFIGEDSSSSGRSVSSAGDVDGDGLDDLLIGAPNNDDGGPDAGKTYLILGSSLGSNSTIDLSTADYAFIGENTNNNSGNSVSSAGDVDGDGLDDLLIGAYRNSDGGPGAGKTYLILGSSLGSSSTIDLSTADYAFIGENNVDQSGHSVSSAGDVDGDGLDDLLIGAFQDADGGTNAGKTYLILGSSLGSNSTIDLSTADYSFIGENDSDFSGSSVSSAGDVDGDGLDDLLIGAPHNADGGAYAGKSYLILGLSLGSSSTIDLSTADYAFIGENANQSGSSVSSAGDVDGDGLDDLLIGTYGNADGGVYAGQSYLILGSSLGSSSTIDLSTADYSFIGENTNNNSGSSVSSAGDVDGDGLDDLLIGTYGNADGGNQAGKSYLILGSSLGSSSTIDLSTADYAFIGENANDYSGLSVSSAGDVDGDGLDDLLIGADGNDDGGYQTGKVALFSACEN